MMQQLLATTVLTLLVGLTDARSEPRDLPPVIDPPIDPPMLPPVILTCETPWGETLNVGDHSSNLNEDTLCHCQASSPSQLADGEGTHLECISRPPDYCRLEEGVESEWLGPSESWISEDGCSTCVCHDGVLRCLSMLCLEPSCDNPEREPGVCCPVCPKECRTKSGTVVPMGEETKEGDFICSCTAGGAGSVTLVCRPEGCLLDNGDLHPPGKSWQEGCQHCYCSRKSELQCAMMACALPYCDGYYVPEGGCCPVCPKLCETPSGQEVPEGKWKVEGNLNCSCNLPCPDIEDEDGERGDPTPEIHCQPLGCQTSDGLILPDKTPGDLLPSEDPCTLCFCDGEWKAACKSVWKSVDCAPPLCADPVKDEDRCCPYCPHGNNCRLDSGEIIPAGRRVSRDGKFCWCRARKRRTKLVARCRRRSRPDSIQTKTSTTVKKTKKIVKKKTTTKTKKKKKKKKKTKNKKKKKKNKKTTKNKKTKKIKKTTKTKTVVKVKKVVKKKKTTNVSKEPQNVKGNTSPRKEVASPAIPS